VDDPEDVEALVSAVNAWRAARPRLQAAAAEVSAVLREYSWTSMAEAFVSAALAAEDAAVS
jgi:hypothetical protein